MKVESRKAEANHLEREGASPRTVALIRPRELTRQDVERIFYREMELREMFVEEMMETDDEHLIEKQIVLDTLMMDRINNEFTIEQEDYNLGVQ